MKSAVTFARGKDVRIVVHNTVFVLPKAIENFNALDHTKFALHCMRRFHALDAIPLPNISRDHDLLHPSFHFVGIPTISAVIGEMFRKSISFVVSSNSCPILPIF